RVLRQCPSTRSSPRRICRHRDSRYLLRKPRAASAAGWHGPSQYRFLLRKLRACGFWLSFRYLLLLHITIEKRADRLCAPLCARWSESRSLTTEYTEEHRFESFVAPALNSAPSRSHSAPSP